MAIAGTPPLTPCPAQPREEQRAVVVFRMPDEVFAVDGRWAVQTVGTQRADSLHQRKSEALRRGRELAERKRTELVIKGENGRIVGKDSHGNDPRRIPG